VVEDDDEEAQGVEGDAQDGGVAEDASVAVSVHVDDWSFRIWLVDEECMVIAHDGDAEIIGSSIQEVIFGVLNEYTEMPTSPAVRYLRRHLYHVLEDVRTVLWSLAEEGEESTYWLRPYLFHTHPKES